MGHTTPKNKIPVVFISSTVEDLKPYRAAARDAAISAGFHPVMFEHWTARDQRRPAAESLNQVSQANVLVVIVAHRYGWVPSASDQSPKECKSITWLECEKARGGNKEVLAFVVDKDAEWQAELKEAHRMTVALEQRKATPELLEEVQHNLDLLHEFKRWLEDGRIRATFGNLDEFSGKLGIALRDWRKRYPEFSETCGIKLSDMGDPRKYLELLRQQTAWIDIRGLEVGTGKAHRFPIEDLYIPLTTRRATGKPRKSDTAKPAARKKRRDATAWRRVELQEALADRRLVIVGDPGAGKTTFLRRIALALSDPLPEEKSPATSSRPKVNGTFRDQDDTSMTFRRRLVAALRRASSSKKREIAGATEEGGDRPFPILIRISDLGEHIRNCYLRQGYSGPTRKESPQWIVDFLNTQNAELNWGLDEAFFRRKLEDGYAILLLDGLDEAPTRIERESMARLVENATHAYNLCQFVVTTRPLVYAGEATMADFHGAQIEALSAEAIERFLEHWCRGLFPESSLAAERHLAELSEALRSRREIRDMATNPVMLTALAVLHWNERRLPEQRADLYESILTWLARSRQKRPGREPAERCLTLLQHLALGMQDHPRGRQVQVSKGWAAEVLSSQFPMVPEGERFQKAQEFLDDEEVDSGIIVSRAGEIRFWHLTFQEYLAARAIAGQPDSAQHELLLTGNKIYKAEWREVALLLGGVLRVKQGQDKVDGLITAILKRLGTRPPLEEVLRFAGLLQAMLGDLRPLRYEPADPRLRPWIDQMHHALKTLTPREEKVIKLRFGWQGQYTLEEVGQAFAATRKLIQQIETKALRKLRHPSRSRRFAGFVPFQQPEGALPNPRSLDVAG
jgi:hypothetical protein